MLKCNKQRLLYYIIFNMHTALHYLIILYYNIYTVLHYLIIVTNFTEQNAS